MKSFLKASHRGKVVKVRDAYMVPADEFFDQLDRKKFVRLRLREFRECDLYEPAAHILADVLGLDEADAKGLILGRQTWKMYKENNLKGRLPSYRELKKMCGAAAGLNPSGSGLMPMKPRRRINSI